MKTDIYSLHRRKSEHAEDHAVIPNGTRSQVLGHFASLRPNQRTQYFAVLGGWNLTTLSLRAWRVRMVYYLGISDL
jgi:hypothetical protein